MKRAATVLVLVVLIAVSVYFSYHPEKADFEKSLPMDVRRVPSSVQAAYGPATWRLLDLRVTDRLGTDQWNAAAPPTGTWVVARFTYHLDAAPPEEYWCEVIFTDDEHRRYETQTGTTIAGQPLTCVGEEQKRAKVGGDFAFTVAALVPKDAADRVRPQVTVRSRLPEALVFG